MAIRRKRESRDQRRFTRNSTNRGFVIRPPAHPWRIVGGVLAVVITVAVALVWGSYLKARSDAFRAAQERGEWTVEAESSVNEQISVPDINAMAIKPLGNVGDIIITGSHDGVIMTLNTKDGTLCYQSDVGERAGLPLEQEAPSLKTDVDRVAKRELNVTCAFIVTCFDAENTATHTYLRGLEIALLREYAESGMDDILLLGLPAGSNEEDARSMEFLRDLRETLSDLPEPPAIGVALGLHTLTTKDHVIPPLPETELSTEDETSTVPPVRIPTDEIPHYVGDVTPARLLSVCDYLAVDLRALTMEEVDVVLPHLPYAYTRYSLRLLVDKNTPAIAEEILSHGFERVFEMNP